MATTFKLHDTGARPAATPRLCVPRQAGLLRDSDSFSIEVLKSFDEYADAVRTDSLTRYPHRWSSTLSESTDSLVSAISQFPVTPQDLVFRSGETPPLSCGSSSAGSDETLVPYRRSVELTRDTVLHSSCTEIVRCVEANLAEETCSPDPFSADQSAAWSIRLDEAVDTSVATFAHPPSYAPHTRTARPSLARLHHLTCEYETRLSSFRSLSAPLIEELQLHMDGRESKLDDLLLASLRRASSQALEAVVMMRWFRESRLVESGRNALDLTPLGPDSIERIAQSRSVMPLHFNTPASPLEPPLRRRAYGANPGRFRSVSNATPPSSNGVRFPRSSPSPPTSPTLSESRSLRNLRLSLRRETTRATLQTEVAQELTQQSRLAEDDGVATKRRRSVRALLRGVFR